VLVSDAPLDQTLPLSFYVRVVTSAPLAPHLRHQLQHFVPLATSVHLVLEMKHNALLVLVLIFHSVVDFFKVFACSYSLYILLASDMKQDDFATLLACQL
jgi:hypothetical protein